MADKVIVTNRGALKKKYGTTGLKKIQSALTRLVKSDKARGMVTKVVFMDDPKSAKALNTALVTESTNPTQNKRAMDGVYNALTPDYLLILGGPDIVPHQDLKNPVYEPGNDDDRIAWGDLPYACSGPYNQDPAKFVGPTRVVSRLPDAPNVTDPSLLSTLLETAIGWTTRQRPDYMNYFAISAAVWQGSTRLSLQNTFGADASLKLSPPQGPQWTHSDIGHLSHFINCHGAPSDFHFYGQQQSDYPEAHDASWLAGKIAASTVVAAECCYGGELYDPTDTQGQMGICFQYLKEGAYAFFGSSTIAYGPANGNGSADLICQYFVQRVLAGASTGRAALEARQKFVENSSMTDPVDLKTLAQFNLLGDPSIQAVEKVKPHLVPLETVAKALGTKAGSKKMAASEAAARKERRRALYINGSRIAQNQPVVAPAAPGGLKAAVKGALYRLAEEAGLTKPSIRSYRVAMPRTAKEVLPKGMKAMATSPSLFHVVMSPGSAGPSGRKYPSVLVAREVSGNIVAVRHLLAKIPSGGQ